MHANKPILIAWLTNIACYNLTPQTYFLEAKEIGYTTVVRSCANGPITCLVWGKLQQAQTFRVILRVKFTVNSHIATMASRPLTDNIIAWDYFALGVEIALIFILFFYRNISYMHRKIILSVPNIP